MDLWRIYPGGETLTVAGVMSGLGLGDLAPPGRPYLVVNFVASADGKATFEGRSGKLGGDTDSALFHRLRTQVDAVLVGSGTLRAERYGRLVRDPELRAAREAEGLAPDPVACVVSRSLSLPLDIPLFQDPEQRTIVFTSSDERLDGAGPGVSVGAATRRGADHDERAGGPARPPWSALGSLRGRADAVRRSARRGAGGRALSLAGAADRGRRRARPRSSRACRWPSSWSSSWSGSSRPKGSCSSVTGP